MVLPPGTRTAAMSLYLLIMGIVNTPSAQIIGFVCFFSNFIRLFDIFSGDSTIEEDRFHAFRKALLVSNIFMFASSLFFGILVAFFKEDCRRAEMEKEIEEPKEDAGEERRALLETKKGRTESVLDTYIRSRATTLDL
ncbi:hypothetical protein PMAYCL1PPCAC_22524, partial [Pristionchus mayeri]